MLLRKTNIFRVSIYVLLNASISNPLVLFGFLIPTLSVFCFMYSTHALGAKRLSSVTAI